MGNTSYCYGFWFLMLLLYCWAVASSHVAEETNAGVTIFVAEITSMCGLEIMYCGMTKGDGSLQAARTAFTCNNC